MTQQKVKPLNGHVGKQIRAAIARKQRHLADWIAGRVSRLSIRQQKYGLVLFSLGATVILVYIIFVSIHGSDHKPIEMGTITRPYIPMDSVTTTTKDRDQK